MNCKEFQNRVLDDLEMKLLPDEKQEWERHRQSCTSCRKEVEALENLQQELRGIPPATPLPPVFWSRQFESIRTQIDRTPRRLWQRFWQTVFQPRLAVAATMAALILFVGYQFWEYQIFSDKMTNRVAFQFSGEDLKVEWEEISGEQEDLDLDDQTVTQYYAFLAQKYLPSDTEDWDDDDAIDNLSAEELDRVIGHFEQTTSRRSL